MAERGGFEPPNGKNPLTVFETAAFDRSAITRCVCMAPQSGRMVCRFTRKKAGLSQVKFASALGVSVKKVSAWEHGKAVPDEAETEKIRGMGK